MLNQCNFIGRFGADPECRHTPAGKLVASFRIAASEKRGGNENTEWVSVVAWEKTAEFVEKYLKKGAFVFVSGRMQTRKWQDKSGADRYTTEIIASTVQSLGSQDKPAEKQSAPRGQQPMFGDNDDVPF